MGSKRENVMLAYPADEKRLLKMPDEVIFQRKLNGERVRIEWKDGKPTLWSSCNNEMPFFKNLKEELLDLKLHGVSFDGEMYCHGMSREEIHGICSRRVNRHPDEDLLSLHAFDIIDTDEQFNQKARILTLNSLFIPGEKIVKVQSILASKESLIPITDQFIKEGYEGSIIRNPNGLYTPRKTGLMLKLKPTAKDTYRIIGYTEEVDIHGWLKGRLGSVTVIDDDGHIFSVGTGNALDDNGRAYWWKHRETLKGLYATVKHSTITTVNGFPTCTSLLKIEIGKNTPE